MTHLERLAAGRTAQKCVRLAAAITVGAIGSPFAHAHSATVVPTVYEAGHFYATPETTTGQQLKLLVDTGGGGGSGMYWITAGAARRLGLDTRDCRLGKDKLVVAGLPDFKANRGLPLPIDSPCGNTLMVQSGPYHGGDGQLGAGYLPGRVWTFDYPAHQLLVQGPSWRPEDSAHAATIGLANGFARVMIEIAGDSIPMLLDTGATAHPTAAGKKAAHTPTVNGYGVTSYIDKSVFDRWRKAHPGWRVVPDGDDRYGPELIRVPNVVVAGWSVGPVWFTVQSHMADYMSRYTDSPIKGALGGNVFHHFVMTVDYPRATAYFRCTMGCEPIAPRPPGSGKAR